MEDGSDDDKGGTPATVAEKRRTQRAIFQSWLHSEEGKEALKPRPKDRGRGNNAEDSISTILAQQQEGSKIVQNPRDYQIELFERAKNENTIAVLDTGSGKTLIAVLLLRWVIDRELEARAANKPPQVSYFLVPSVNLVYQQFSVLVQNLDYQIARQCGADEVDSWRKDRWDQLLATTHCVVCTPDILCHCLARGFVTIKHINLLIFDEAHHAKRNHAYARIIKDFYNAAMPSDRPRVFGMTASPVDARDGLQDATVELETLLHSRIATTTNMSLSSAVKKPTLSYHRYTALPQFDYETDLLTAIRQRYSHIYVFDRSLVQASGVAQMLGSWCTDRFLEHICSAPTQTRCETIIEQRHFRRMHHYDVASLDNRIAEYRAALRWIRQWAWDHPKPTQPQNFSSKVLAINDILHQHFERKTDHRCIVFVEQKITAYLLHEVFSTVNGMGTKHLHTGYLVGSSGAYGADDRSFSFRQQILTLSEFRKGEINCLFATSVAEEGLDVPDCNLVVRFDPCKTMIQFVQSRGRARNQHSKFIHMVEMGNGEHENLIRKANLQELYMKQFYESLGPDRYLVGNEDCLETVDENDQAFPPYVIPSTGAKLTQGNALGFLATFASAIPTETGEAQHPTYVVSGYGGQFTAEVILPDKAPFRSVVGPRCARKALAKRTVAFQACITLLKQGYLDDHLQPTYQKRVPAMQNALLAVDVHKKAKYINRVKPALWAHDRGTWPPELWLNVIDFPQGLDRPHRPLVLLTRKHLPQFPNFPVFLNDAQETAVVSTPIDRPLAVTQDKVVLLATFTFQILRDVFSKTYEEDATKLSYWLAPGTTPTVGFTTNPAPLIDWSLLAEVAAKREYKWYPEMPNERLINKFLVDVWDGSRKYYSQSINPYLKPTDSLPNDVEKTRFSNTIIDYSVSLWRNARQKHQWNSRQPVINAEKLLTRRNMLAPPQTKETSRSTKAVLCPEPLRISVLPIDVVVAAVVFPAVIHRYESYLISTDGCDIVGIDCDMRLSLAAFTKDSDNSGDHWTDERVNFQHGMGENYERLEFLGDTFLKLATTISTFVNSPGENQFGSHVARMLMLCNKNLFLAATKLQLYEYIRCMSFSRRLWYPEGIRLLGGKGAKKEADERDSFHETQEQPLGEKTIADVCEALIGAALLSHYNSDKWAPSQWEQAIRAVTKLVNNDHHTMLTWNDYRAAYTKPEYQLADATATQRYLAAEVEAKHAYRFKYPRLLYSAFLHPSSSYMAEHIPNYERLEFLGDALLDMVSVTFLFNRNPTADPQWLTEYKRPMICNQFFGALCVLLDFHCHLRHTTAGLDKQIVSYITELQEARDAGVPHCLDFWTQVSEPPKCLADMVEAYVAAMFIDSNFNYAEVQRFFDTHIKHFFEDMSVYASFTQNHPFRRLHVRLRTELGCQEYMTAAEEIPVPGDVTEKQVVVGVVVHRHVLAHSKGKSDRYARVRAALRAVEALDGLSPSEFRAQFGCDCGIKTSMM